MSQYRIAIVHEFDAGHRLLGDAGKCITPHGHTYRAELVVAGETLDDRGMVHDFRDLKSAMKQWIDENWDHAFLVNEADLELVEALRSLSMNKLYLFAGNPTAENIAAELHKHLVPLLESNLFAIRIWETASQYAEYRGSFDP